MKIKCKCKYCGIKFYVPLCNIKKGYGKYCSIECYNLARDLLHKTHNCKVCGQKFNAYISAVKHGEGKYCSKKCQVFSMIRNIKRTCLICKKEFVSRPSENKKYCSRKCYNKDHYGEKNNFWKGGTSFEPYTTDWTATLRRSIRERDGYICQLCGQHQENIALCVHHVDYCKENCNPSNLVSLCAKCHRKTNYNRKHWKNLFRK